MNGDVDNIRIEFYGDYITVSFLCEWTNMSVKTLKNLKRYK